MIELRFDNLPLVEVVVRMTIEDKFPLSLPFAGDLLEALRDGGESEFQLVESAAPELTPGVAGFELSSLPIMSFGSKSEPGLTMHFQERHLRLMWVRTTEGKYPGFTKALLPTLKRFFTALNDLIGPQRVIVLNMGYRNLIQGVEPRHVDEFVKLPVIMKQEDLLYHFEYAWRDAGGFDHRASLSRQGTDKTVYTELTNTVGKRLSEEEECFSSLAIVHDLLCGEFRENLTDRAKREWQFIESGNRVSKARERRTKRKS